MKIRNLFCAALSFAALSASAMVDSVQMFVQRLDGSSYTETLKLEKIAPDTLRLKLPFAKYAPWQWKKINFIDFYSEDATAAKGEDGYWVNSGGALGTFRADNGLISGESKRNPMQMWGFKKGDEAFVAIVKELKYEFKMVVKVENGVYQMYPVFDIAGIGMPIYQDIVIDFTYFKGKKANYSSMGKAYRKYQLDRGEVRPLKERIAGNPRLKYTSEAVFLKFMMASFMRQGETHLNRGFHWKNVDAPNIQVYRNFDNMMNVLKKLKEIGVEKADIVVTNWNWRSNGRCPIYGVAEPELGGNAKCRELTAFAKKMGYQISPHILHTENYTVSPAFNKDDLALQKNGGYIHYDGMGGEAYNPCWHQVYYKQVLENYTNMQQLGFNGPIHIDVTSAISPYRCFDLNHFCTRNDTAFYMNQVGLLSDGFFGGWTSESSCDQTANTLDYALYVSAYPSYLGAQNKLITRMIPIWQLAYHGIIMSNPFASTIDYNARSRPSKGWGPTNSFTPQTRRLKFVEFGGRLTYYWNLMHDSTLEDVAKAYQEYKPLRYLQLEYMDFHDEIAPDVFLTVYGDGSEIVTNYSQKPFAYKKQNVPAMEYKLFKPAK